MANLSEKALTVGDGIRFGIGFTLGSMVAALILIPVFACIGFVIMTALGGSLAALLEMIPQ